MGIAFDQLTKAFSVRRKIESADAEVRLAFSVARDADRDVVASLREGFVPLTATARLDVSAIEVGSATPARNALCDAAVVVAGICARPALGTYRSYAEAGLSCCFVAPASLGEEAILALVDGGVDSSDLVVCRSEGAAEAVGLWLVSALEGRAPALSAGFACCRRARALVVAREAVRDNVMVGLVPLGGADFPAMLAAEVAMMLKMADSYGLPLDWSRLGEASAILASSYGLRGISRALSSRLPLPGRLVGAAVAGLGTYAMGRALMAYYEALCDAERTAAEECPDSECRTPAGEDPVATRLETEVSA